MSLLTVADLSYYSACFVYGSIFTRSSAVDMSLSEPDVSQVALQYEAAYAEHGCSLNSLFIPKGRQKERFDALTDAISSDGFSILDFGCGFAHLKSYLDSKFKDFRYHGADITESFILENQARFDEKAQGTFQYIQHVADIQGQFDYVLSAGVFNLKYCADPILNRQFVLDTVKALFEKATIAMMIDFMPADVDYQAPNAYHQDVMEIYQLFRQNLTRRLKLDLSYMPYEFCLTAFKDQEIIRPDNIYRSV